jgi:hypothetical protein
MGAISFTNIVNDMLKYTKNICCFLLCLSVLLTGCKQEWNENGPSNHEYIKDVQVLADGVNEIKINNSTRTITIFFERGTDISDVEIKLTLSSDAHIVNPSSLTARYNLNDNPVIQIKSGNDNLSYQIVVKYVSKPLRVSRDTWEKQSSFGDLPSHISIYKYKRDVGGKSAKAYIAVAAISEKEGKFKVLGEKTGVKTLNIFYQQNSKPAIVLNGGYFWNETSLGLMVRDQQTISHIQPIVNRDYRGVATLYYPTQGAFGQEKDHSFSARWVYTSNNILYSYPHPAPNKAGEVPCSVPSATYPSGAQKWNPIHAISAGPLLIKDGEYKNLWENEMFDSASGVGPTYYHPRSAIGYHPYGYVVLFVCEGRDKTPNIPGMTLKNVADILINFGCTEAINLDGGGSSCMLVNGKETIIPSDKNGQRPVTNAVAVY